MPNYPTYKLGEVVDIYSGFGFPKHLQGRKTGKYPFFKVGDISKNVQAGYKHLNFCENYIDDDELRLIKGVLLPISSIVFAKIGEALKLNRRAITTNLCLIDNNAIGVKSKTEMCDDLYLYYYLTTIKLEDYSRATTVPSVRKSDIEQIPIPLPPLPTQRAIVTRIETLFAELDKGVEKLKTAQQQLKVYRQAVLNDCLTKGSEKWEKVKLGDVAEKIFDGPFGTHLKSDDYVSSGIRVVRLENIKTGYFDDSKQSFVTPEKYEIIKRHTVYPTDLIMSTFISEEVKVCQMPKHIEFAVNKADCIGIRLKASANNDFIKYYLSLRSVYHQLEIQVHGATRPRVNTTQIKNIEINLPPLPEQQRIVQEIETRLSACDEVEKQIAESLQQAEALRQSILKKAFSGELV